MKNQKSHLKKSLRIGINAQIPSNSGAGGIERVIHILLALNQFGGDEEYVFIGHWSDSDWLAALLGERQTLVRAPNPEKQFKAKKTENLKRLMGKFRPFARDLKNFLVPSNRQKIAPAIPVSDGFFESLDCDVIHFPYQDYIYCRDVPAIYNPHDLQHRHFPQYFTAEEFERREIIYPAACRAANQIVVASDFVKQDLIESYQLESEKIQVIPWGFFEIELKEFSQSGADEILVKHDCPPRPFALYPAMVWEHKNHLRLIEAVALLRDRENLKINLVCTGHKTSFYYEQIEKRLRELNLESQIRFTGIIEYQDLSMFFRLAQFVVVPTLFEAASGPVFEAWQHNTPVACSAITSLPEQAAEAALLFDPHSVEAIAGALKKMSLDEKLREEYRRRGFRRLQDFGIERMAKSYQAIYRKVAGFILTDEERDLLQ